jgi:ribulose-5-phosphate 4-epimerase/fuculose-1-phosphate aldolase
MTPSTGLNLFSVWCDMLKKQEDSALEEKLCLAAARLAGKGLLKPGDRLSERVPERDAFIEVLIKAGQDVPQEVTWANLNGLPRSLHHQIYAARPDVGAIASGKLTWTSALARLDMSLPAVFDEQVRHLGVEAKRVGMRSTDHGPIAALSNGANAYCLDDTALCFGMGLERLLLNIEILEKSAECFVLAQSAVNKVKRIPWLIKFIANGRLRKDQKDAATHHLRGERSIMKAGY